jgi:hypothetical protein
LNDFNVPVIEAVSPKFLSNSNQLVAQPKLKSFELNAQLNIVSPVMRQYKGLKMNQKT